MIKDKGGFSFENIPEQQGRGSTSSSSSSSSSSWRKTKRMTVDQWWSSTSGQGILGQGYGGTLGDRVQRRFINSLGTLTTHGTHGGGTSSSSSMSFISRNQEQGLGPNQNHTGISTMGGNYGTSSSFFSSSNMMGGGHLSKLSPGSSIPKTPRPNKTNSVIVSLTEGLKGILKMTQDEMDDINKEINELHSNSAQQWKIYDLEKQSKTSGRYFKRIEFQLTLVEELNEKYILQQKLLEGVRTMANAFTVSNGTTKEYALANIKAGFRECNEQLCILESKLELLLGCFKMEMKGIQGFARLCQGDVYEITMKHGNQKWKLRGKIEKNGEQIWDYPKATFRAVFGELIYIKASEIKTFSKHILLGNKFCEINELFSSCPQLMTINLNPSGSLKLNVIVTWNPLDSSLLEDHHGKYSSGSLRSIASLNSISPRNSFNSNSKKRRLSPTQFQSSCPKVDSDDSLHLKTKETLEVGSTTSLAMGNQRQMNSISTNSRHSELWKRSLDTIGGQGLLELDSAPTAPPRSSTRNGSCSFRFSPITPYNKNPRYSNSMEQLEESPQVRKSSGSSSQSQSDSDPSGNFTFMTKRPSNSSNQLSDHQMNAEMEERMDKFSSEEDGDDGIELIQNQKTITSCLSLRESVMKLSSLLEDIQGQYPELESLELHVGNVEKMIQSPCFESSASLNIESALECFDFLDSVTLGEDQESTEDLSKAINPIFNNVASSSSGRYRHRNLSNEILDPKMTARTTDSGVSSMGHGSQYSRTPSPPGSRISSPVPALLTGNHQLDLALEAHIFICLQLIHVIGSYGPMKCREKEALSKLQQQGIILGNILSRAKNETGTNGLSELASLSQLQVLWEKITNTGSPLCATVEQVIHGLEEEIRPIVSYKYKIADSSLSKKVSQLLVDQLLHTTGDFLQPKPEQIISVFQFQMFLRPHEHSFHKLVEDLVEEEIFQNHLLDDTKIEEFVKTLPRNQVPPKSVLITLVRSLLHTDVQVQKIVKEYFQEMSQLPTLRRQLIQNGLEILEFHSWFDRQSACICLSLLNAKDAIEELAYCAQTDPRLEVRNEAKQALMLQLGTDEGDRIHQQLTLSTHGFQGLNVS